MKLHQLVLSLSVLLAISCVKTDDFETPTLIETEIEIDGNLTSISAVKGNYNFQTGQIYNFQNTNTYFEGYVISNDAGGNFYKEVILQDKASNPTSGIQILIDDNSVSETFNFGRKVLVKLDGLSLWYNNGVLQLGIQNRGDVVAVPNALIGDYLIRTGETAEIIPLQLEISDFSEDQKNLYITLSNVQFNRNLVKEDNLFSFASNPVDQFDGERQLENCETGETIILSTSTFSNFKSLLLPQGSGTVEGVLTRDFFDDYFVLVINSPDKLDMNDARCDPEFLECGTNITEGTQLIFEENFDGVTSNTILNSRDFTNINVSGGEEKFEPKLVNGNRVLRISAFNTLESPLEAWLVTPEINLDNTSSEILSFDLLASYDNGLLLRVFVTTNFTGDPLTTNWKELDANIPLGPSNQFSTIFKESIIDISCLEGEVWIGFQYLGAAPDKTTTYDLDNIRVMGN